MTWRPSIRIVVAMSSPSAPVLSGTDPAGYVLGRSEAEAQRLQLQHRIYGGATRALLVDGGVEPGMRVLDVGSGCGDVALLLADLVGPTGGVVGVEVAPETIAIAERRVADAGVANVRFVEADLRDLRLDEPAFDAVVGRWVLMYQPDPVFLLRRLAEHAAPEAVIAFQESDLIAVHRPVVDAPTYEQLLQWMTPPADFGGPELRMGPKLYDAYLAAGLPAPSVRIDTPVGGGRDWPGYGFLAATLRSVLPVMTAMGLIDPEAVDIDTLEDRLRDEVVSQHGLLPLPSVYGAAARLA
jgi:SAM-dependent methyltransferase